MQQKLKDVQSFQKRPKKNGSVRLVVRKETKTTGRTSKLKKLTSVIQSKPEEKNKHKHLF